jgi:hypothetical protein
MWKLAMLEDYFEEEDEEEQKQEASAEVAITNDGQWNQPTALPSVFFLQPKKGHSLQVRQCMVSCSAEYHTKVNL